MVNNTGRASSIGKLSSTVAGLVFVVLGGVASFGVQAADEGDRLRGMMEPLVAEQKFTIGGSLVHLEDDFWSGIAYGIMDEARLSGVDVLPLTYAGGYGEVAAQLSELEALRAKGVQAIALGASANKGFSPILKSLKNDGIDTVAAGIVLDGSDVAFGVLQEQPSIGEALGERICEDVEEKKLDKSQVRILALVGPAGAEWAQQRYEGFMKVMGECGLEQVTTAPRANNVGVDVGLKQTSDLLSKVGKPDYVYAPEISLGMGAVQALRRSSIDSAPVVTSALIAEAVPLIKDGYFLAVNVEPGILMGRLIVQTMIRYREGKDIPDFEPRWGLDYPVVPIYPYLVDSSNIDEYDLNTYDIPPRD